MAINNLGKKGLFQLIFPNLQSTRKGSQNRTQGNKLESGIDVEAVQECCLLACSSCLLSMLSYTTQDHQPRGGTSAYGMSHPISIFNQDNTLETCLQ